MERRKWVLYLHETFNSITHGVGVLIGIAALVLLLVFASLNDPDAWKTVSFSIYGGSLIITFMASTLFHAFRKGKTKDFFQLIDHSSIYVLIAGTYTPFCLVSLRGPWGWTLFGVIWGCAIAGVLFKVFFYTDKLRFVSTALYLAMGWMILIALGPLIRNVPAGGLYWLLAGALSYSFGVIFYLWRKYRWNHVIWHLFVLGGSVSHFFAIFNYVMPD